LVLELRGLECGYPGKPVLKGLDLTIRAGERVALLGPNGSGKSTLIRAVSGLLKPSAGEIRLGGYPIGSLNVREIARRVSTVPQEESPRFAFTVRQVVTMGRLSRSAGLFDTPDDVAAATKAMDMADCLEFEARSAGELSGGERQRVLIARALAQDAPLMLLDEPTSHLDPAHQVAVAKLVRNLAGVGVATLAAVHDLNFAARMADRAILLDQGRICADDAVEGVLASPALDRVYAVSFLRARVEGQYLVSPTS
jgi:iron complex transport system ATP-binding protein